MMTYPPSFNSLPSWGALARRFSKIVYDAEGPSKSKSGIIEIIWRCCEDEIYVNLGTYDIADWSSWTTLGPFENDEQARLATEKKLNEAAKAIEQEKRDDTTC
jgi:hypothetical protein